LLLINDTNETGGAESHFWDSVKLLREKHDVATLTFGSSEVLEGRDLVIKESPNSHQRKLQGFLTSVTIRKKIKKIINQLKPEIIHVHNVHKYPSAILGALKGRKVVHTIHDYGYVCPTSWSVVQGSLKICPAGYGMKCLQCLSFPEWIGQGIYHPKKARLLKNAVSVSVCPSKKLLEYMQRHGFPNPVYVPHFADTKKWFPEKVERDPKLLLYVGGLTAQKGVSFLIKAMPEILKKEALLEVAGEGKQKQELLDLVDELRLGNHVKFIGRLSDDELRLKYSSVACLVIPSVWMEQFGLVGAEALLCGCPVVGSEIGGIPDWLKEGETGLLARRADSRSLAEAVLKVLENPTFAKRLSDNGKEFIRKEFSKEQWLMKIEKIYLSLAS